MTLDDIEQEVRDAHRSLPIRAAAETAIIQWDSKTPEILNRKESPMRWRHYIERDDTGRMRYKADHDGQTYDYTDDYSQEELYALAMEHPTGDEKRIAEWEW